MRAWPQTLGSLCLGRLPGLTLLVAPKHVNAAGEEKDGQRTDERTDGGRPKGSATKKVHNALPSRRNRLRGESFRHITQLSRFGTTTMRQSAAEAGAVMRGGGHTRKEGEKAPEERTGRKKGEKEEGSGLKLSGPPFKICELSLSNSGFEWLAD